MKNKSIISAAFLFWLTIILALFFIVQKPAAMSIMNGLFFMFATIVAGILFAVAGAGIGYFILSLFHLEFSPSYRLIFSAGLGMGMLGLAGFGMAAIDFANGWETGALLIVILVWLAWRKYLSLAQQDLHDFWRELADSAHSSSSIWIARFAILELVFSFLLSLAPPVEAFDGLFYHLEVPSRWLRDGGLQLVNMPHYWFPSLMEGMFVWPLSLDLDSTPQIIHLIFGILSVLLIWVWTRSLFNDRAAWWSMAMFLCMPSLPWLAAWAYTDLGLIFFSLSTLFALLKWKESSNDQWLFISGMMAGFSIGIKYTSFVLPLVSIFLLFWWTRNESSLFVRRFIKFVSAAVLIGFPWYLRNWLWTGNPVYPFVFGGQNWDAFRSAWYAGTGSGIGWDFLKIFSLPLVATLGYRDANFFDGRFGPFYLILFPIILWVVWKAWKGQGFQKEAVGVLFLFSLFNIVFWVFGVIQTDYLMQARLLWPGLISLIPLMSAGIVELDSLDTLKFRPSFVVTALIKLTILIFLLDFCLFVIVRNPIMVAMGSESRESYTARMQPGYAQALNLVNQTPSDAFIYLLTEPRSYGMNRRVQPDSINDNLAHDFHVYATNEELLNAWRKAGYTHILASKSIFDRESVRVDMVDKNYFERLEELKNMLREVDQTENDYYFLFEIPMK